MVRLAQVPTNIPQNANLMTYIKTTDFQNDCSLIRMTRPNANSELWRLIEILRAAHLKYKPEKCYNLHQLKGKYQGFYDCHIEGDLVLIFTYIPSKNNKPTLVLHRFGTHNKVF